METVKPTVTRRISSFFSLGGDNATTKVESSSIKSPSSRDSSPSKFQSKSNRNSGLRLSPSQVFQTSPSPPLLQSSPALATELTPPLPDQNINQNMPGDVVLQPPTPIDDRILPYRSWSPRRKRSEDAMTSRPISPARSSRSASPGKSEDGSRRQSISAPDSTKLGNRKSWMRRKSRGASVGGLSDGSHGSGGYWILTAQGRIPYDVSYLVNSQRVTELWDESGDTLVHLFPKESGKSPSFRVSSSMYSASSGLTMLAYGRNYNERGRQSTDRYRPSGEQSRPDLHSRPSEASINTRSSSPMSSLWGSSIHEGSQGTLNNRSSNSSRPFSENLSPAREETNLYIPVPLMTDLSTDESRLGPDDLESLVAVRNLFAFLVGQSLVATPKCPTTFLIFSKIAEQLEQYQFSNLDGSSYGEVAASSFARYIAELNLADIRSSRDKTMEAILLGERMRCYDLYNEGFVHGVGKYDDLVKLDPTKFEGISQTTRKRMERASLDLDLRLRSLQSRLDDFYFPSLFSGFANSTTSDESKMIRFKAWKNGCMMMRRHVLSHYKQQYGAWPPKAKSKKNDFEESGLNRILLNEVYRDFSDLYDMLVDRTSLTTRTSDLLSHPVDAESMDPQEPLARSLRRVLSEFDRSSPPVQPPIPFDVPLTPSLPPSRRALDEYEAKKFQSRKLKDDEIDDALIHSYNPDALSSTPFISAFRSFERKSAHGKSIDEISELRFGQWIFLYAVIQSLPMVVVDAPLVKYSDGVEYFLCEVPKGANPWGKAKHPRKASQWYGISGGTGVVSLPADVVDHGVEGIYRRSHCWKAAAQWTSEDILPPEDEGAATQGVPELPAEGTLSDSDGVLSPALTPGLSTSQYSPMLEAPDGSRGSRSTSRSPNRQNRRVSTQLGLEALPLPEGVSPTGAQPVRQHDPAVSFEDILGEGSHGLGLKKKKKGKK